MLDLAQVTFQVEQYLLGQDWQLVTAVALAEQIWPEVEKQGGQKEIVDTLIWQNYAAILYEHCHHPHSDQYQRAWHELDYWLARQVGRYVVQTQEQEEVVQETLLQLQSSLDQVRAPRALFTYLLQILNRKRTDRYRRQTTQKRGEGKVLSLEATAVNQDQSTEWEAQIITDQTAHQVETIMSEKELRQQLTAFFAQHLGSDLQQQVAIASFLDGLSPQEIASLLGKRPHEVRQIKARAKQKLLDLSAADKEQLLAVLGKFDDAGGENE